MTNCTVLDVNEEQVPTTGPKTGISLSRISTKPGLARLIYRYRPKLAVREDLEAEEIDPGDLTPDDYHWEIVGGGDSGEEFQCSMALESLPELKHWLRNISKRPASFWLPMAQG
jgi:hypothetical protein